MAYTVTLKTVASQPIAAVRTSCKIAEIANAWKPALDQVWAYLRAHEDVWAPSGRNLFLYHHPTQRDLPMDIDFGVEVARRFEAGGPVRYIETPAGQVAKTLHVGAYNGLSQAHMAVHQWCAQNGKQIGAQSWETYGDWDEDESKLRTEVFYLLR